jgi:flagellar P-ring protein precursor FlgI
MAVLKMPLSSPGNGEGSVHMKRKTLIGTRGALLLVSILGLAPTASQAGVRLKDITDLEGSQSNHLVGFGLVVGLNGTGSKSTFTQQVAVDMLQRFMVTTKIQADLKGDSVFKSGNIAAVMVTTELGPVARVGSRIDVTVSALDDASSLDNGTLILTPLKGVDGVEYVVAQGPVSVGGYLATASGGGPGTAASAQKNHPTVGRIANGPIVVREARGKVCCNGQLKILLREPDYDTARAIAKVINGKYLGSAFTVDAGTVHIFVPGEQCINLVSFISDILMLEITPETPARVVINERTGTIVAGHHVKISAVAVTHGNLAIVTSNEPIVSQPLPFSRGKTKVLPRAQLGVTEQANSVRVLEETMTVSDLARALNALGAAPRDLIVIFQALKKLGALHAELVFM